MELLPMYAGAVKLTAVLPFPPVAMTAVGGPGSTPEGVMLLVIATGPKFGAP